MISTFFLQDYKNAESAYQQCLAIRKEIIGEQHRETGAILLQLATLYEFQGEFARAEQLLLQGLKIIRNSLGEQHPAAAATTRNLAALYAQMGRLEEAESLFLKSLEMFENALPEDDWSKFTIFTLMAMLYADQGDIVKAEETMRHVLAATRAYLESNALVLSERQQLAMSVSLRSQLDFYIQLASQLPDAEDLAFRQVLAWKGSTLVRQRRTRAVADDTEMAMLFEQLQQVATRLATLLRLSPKLEELADWRRANYRPDCRKGAIGN